jgi:hypothetical protein
MDLQSTESQGVVKALNSLIESLAACKREALVPWAIKRAVFYSPAGATIEGDSAELLIKSIGAWDVMDDADNGNVPRFPAIVEAGSNLIARLRDFNDSKALFERACESLPGSAKDRQLEMRSILKRVGVGRSHPLQCWRRINVLAEYSPKSIGFSVARTSFSTVQMSKQEALEKLKLRDALDVAEILEGEPCESVRWVVPVSPHIKANVSYRDSKGELQNAKLHASLPIIVAEGSWPAKWKFNIPKEPQVRKTAVRSIPLPFRTNAYLALV